MASTHGRFLFVDGLRGCAALSVAMFHIGNRFSGLEFLNYAELGVAVFFVISGFVISHSLINQAVTGAFFASFALKRSLRLDPAYWVAIAMAIVVVWVPGVLLNYDVRLPSLSDVVLHLFYLQGIFGVGQINIVFWTLCYEVQFYLVFCLVLYLMRKAIGYRLTFNITASIFSLLLLISLLWPLGVFTSAFRGSFFVNLWYLFLLGAFARWAYESRFAAIVLFFTIFVLLSRLFAGGDADLHLLAGSVTAVLLFIAISKNKMQQWLNWVWVQYLGRISYSLYLVHDIIGLYVRDTGIHISHKYFGLSSLAISYCWCVAALAASIFAANILYKYVERPSHSLSRKLDIRSVKVGIASMLNYARGR
ncbi:acyltransferase [uncultured Thiodictyon sp.]|nr:acyltransferase [uncultured Thiodictyon sp.]